jgi:hypothetical protein
MTTIERKHTLDFLEFACQGSTSVLIIIRLTVETTILHMTNSFPYGRVSFLRLRLEVFYFIQL